MSKKEKKDLVPAPEPKKNSPPQCCICTKGASFHSGKFEKSFCSDNCYESYQLSIAQAGEAKIIRRKEGKSYFHQAGVKIPVNPKSLEATLGIGQHGEASKDPFTQLMDSQIVTLAHANKIPVEPQFVRELVVPVLKGLLQIVWYRDCADHTSEHLEKNQLARLDLYRRKLSDWKPVEQSEERPRKGASGEPKAPRAAKSWTSSYQAVKGTKNACDGREKQLLEVIKGLKGPAKLDQIVQAAQGKVQTKQDLQKIVVRFLGKLIADGAVQEVK